MKPSDYQLCVNALNESRRQIEVLRLALLKIAETDPSWQLYVQKVLENEI